MSYKQWITLIDVSAFEKKYLLQKLEDKTVEIKPYILKKLYERLSFDSKCIYLIRKPTKEMILTVLVSYPQYILEVEDLTETFIQRALYVNPKVAEYINLSENLQHYLIDLDIENYQYIQNPKRSVINIVFPPNP